MLLNQNHQILPHPHKPVYYLSAVCLILYILLKLPLLEIYLLIIQNFVLFSPVIILLLVFLFAYRTWRRSPEYSSAIVRHYLFLTLKLLLVILAFHLVYTPGVIIDLFLALVDFILLFFSLDSFFYFLSYLLTFFLIIAVIFIAFRAWQKSQGYYEGSIPLLFRKTLYVLFFIFLFFLGTSAYAFPKAFTPMTSALGDMAYSFSGGTIQMKGSDPTAYGKIKSVGDLVSTLSDSLSSTKNTLVASISQSNNQFEDDLDSTKNDLADSIDQAKEDLEDQLNEDIENKVSLAGGTISGDLSVGEDLTIDGTFYAGGNVDLGANALSDANLGNLIAHLADTANPHSVTTAQLGFGLDTDGTLAANSDVLVATQRAVRSYVDNAISGTTVQFWRRNSSSGIIYPINSSSRLEIPEIRARSNSGLRIYEDGGSGLFVEDGGYIGIGNTDPSAKLHITDGAILASGTSGFLATFGGSSLNTTGFFWSPAKGAIRAGAIFYDSFNVEDQWDNVNVGANSFATGVETIASGENSFSIGRQSISSANSSFSFGYSNIQVLSSSGIGSFAMGYPQGLTGYYGINYMTSSGRGSFALGLTGGSINYLSYVYLNSTGQGSFAQGSIYNNIGLNGQGVYSEGNGSFARGGAYLAGKIIASGQGSFAQGFSSGGYYLTSSGIASFAFGNVSTAALTATGNYSWASGVSLSSTADNTNSFGRNFVNSTADTFQVGFGSAQLTVGASSVTVASLVSNGTVYSNAGVLTNTNPSDERLKKNIEDISLNALEKIMLLRPVSFNWKDSYSNDDRNNVGFIAQEVEKVFPDMVAKNEKGYYGIYSSDFVPYLTKAIQIQEGKIVAVDTQIQEVSKELENLKDENVLQGEKLAGLEETIASTNEKISGLENNLSASSERKDTLNDSLSDLEEQMEELEKEAKNGKDNLALVFENQNLLLRGNADGNLEIPDGKVSAKEIFANKAKTKNAEVGRLSLSGSDLSGSGEIIVGETEITIDSDKVSTGSKIYLTPIKNSANLYPDEIEDGESFKVKISSPSNSPIFFNWLIIN